MMIDFELGEVFYQKYYIVKDEQIKESKHDTFSFNDTKTHSIYTVLDISTTLISQKRSDFKEGRLSAASRNRLDRLKLWDKRQS